MRVLWDGLIGPTLKETLFSLPKGPPKLQIKKSVIENHNLPHQKILHQSKSSHSNSTSTSTSNSNLSTSTCQPRNAILKNLTSLLAPIRQAFLFPPNHRPAPIRSTHTVSNGSHTFLRSSRSTFKKSTFIGGLPATNVGLGTARNFSSGAGKNVMDNVVKNVPIWIRALADELEDGKKLKGERKVNGKMGLRKLLKREIMSERRRLNKVHMGDKFITKDLDAFFPSSNSTSSINPPTEPTSFTVLTIPLEPLLPSLPPTPSARLLDPDLLSTLSSLRSIYSLHSTKLSNLEFKLRTSGAWDDILRVEWDFETRMDPRWEGRKVVRYHWDAGGWGIEKIEQALGMWKGEERWFGIEEISNSRIGEELPSEVDPQEASLTITDVSTPTSILSLASSTPSASFHLESEQSRPHSPDLSIMSLSSLSSSTASEYDGLEWRSSRLRHEDEDMHDFVTSHFVLPKLPTPSNRSYSQEPSLGFSASFLDFSSMPQNQPSQGIDDSNVWNEEIYKNGVEGFLQSLEEIGRVQISA